MTILFSIITTIHLISYTLIINQFIIFSQSSYMRHHAIEMNWRIKPIRMPIILKGHDDHVITCLQFCGNQVVSGSDDNTLKVWSVLTGKVSV